MSVNYGSKRLVTGAHYGSRDWLVQRVTATILVVFTLVLVACVLCTSGALTYDSWAAIFAPQWMKFLSLIAFLALAWHAWVGVRDIWMDYVKPAGLRIALHAFTIAWLVGCIGWFIQVLWRV